jgi:putative two-component system response regulator
VLVAEDDRVVSQQLAGLLRGRGYTPILASDAMQTLMFAMREPHPDAILLDVNMPGGTGLEALRRLKASVKTSEIPVLVLSGETDPALPDTVRELGAVAFLAKPVDAPTLLEALGKLHTDSR